jgi:hypothetical protein
MLAVMDGLDRLVTSEVLDALNDGFPEAAELDTAESRDGGSCVRSGK